MADKQSLTLYTNADLSAGAVSGPIFVNKHSRLELYGNTDGSGTFGLQVSTNGADFFSSSNTVIYDGNIFGQFEVYCPAVQLVFPLDMSGLTLNACLSDS
jgi:hypothetical protein